ncbi:MAG: hypothetical protein ACOH2E_00860 [Candidatus Paracaedibacter sp.]
MNNLQNLDTHFVFITGASGAGKTTVLKALEQELPSPLISINFFDSIGVPPLEEMCRIYGSGEKWQELSTHKWIDKLVAIKNKKLIFLEGQFNPMFAISHLQELGIVNYFMFCLYAGRQVREERLIHLRNQPELVNDVMENWSNVLRKITHDVGGFIIDSSGAGVNATAQKIIGILENKLSVRLKIT